MTNDLMTNDLVAAFRSLPSDKQELFIQFLMKLAEEDKPEPETRTLGQMGNPAHRDAYGNKLTAEQIWDKEHPRTHIGYGYTSTFVDFNGKETKKTWSRKEVDEYNRKIDEKWLAEKRKVFPDATLPGIE